MVQQNIILHPLKSNKGFNETVLTIDGNFLNLPPTSRHLHPLQVEKCDINSRLVVNEDVNDKLKHKRAMSSSIEILI